MTEQPTQRFAIDLNDSQAFAALSGDFNPMHLDPVYARRTQFGSSVAHGIHVLLKAIEIACGASALAKQEPSALSVTFSNPVRTGAEVTFKSQRDAASNKIRIQGECAGAAAFTATVELTQKSTAEPTLATDRTFAVTPPVELPFPPAFLTTETPLQVGRAQLQHLFPGLAESENWVADLLATTRIVGMQCPGLHSIFSTCKLRRVTPAVKRATMQYTVARLDERFKMIRLAVQGGFFEGAIEGFFRPAPVAQRSLEEVATQVSGQRFRGHRALVIGGSRGLGELAAKIVLAGGGSAVITYATGSDDAARVCDEARRLGRTCRSEQLDISSLEAGAHPDWLSAHSFSHAYYFASPHIGKSASGNWNAALFDRFAAVYVHAFSSLVECLAKQRSDRQAALNILYPSSVFVSQPPEGFAEYAAAKAAGETLCDSLARQHKIVIQHPRLPRMKTDQTSGQTDTGAQDPFEIIRDSVLALHA